MECLFVAFKIEHRSLNTLLLLHIFFAERERERESYVHGRVRWPSQMDSLILLLFIFPAELASSLLDLSLLKVRQGVCKSILLCCR